LMTKIRYTLTSTDLETLYPFFTAEQICTLFPDNTPTTSTIRRKYKRLGLAPINSALRSFQKTLQALRPIDIPEEEWSLACDETLEELRNERIDAIWQRIRIVESRSVG